MELGRREKRCEFCAHDEFCFCALGRDARQVAFHDVNQNHVLGTNDEPNEGMEQLTVCVAVFAMHDYAFRLEEEGAEVGGVLVVDEFGWG